MSDGSPALHGHSRDSLGTKIILFVFLSSCVTALGVSALSLHSTYTQLRRDAEQRFPDLLERSAFRVQMLLDQSATRIEALAGRSDLRSWVRSGSISKRNAARLKTLLEPERGAAPLFRTLWLLDAKGKLIASAGPEESAPPFPAADLAGVEQPAVRGFASANFAGPVASAPIHARGSKAAARATLHGLIEPSYLSMELQSDGVGVGGNVYLVDAEARILAAARRADGDAPVSLEREQLERHAPRRVGTWDLADGSRALSAFQPLGPWPGAARSPETSAWKVVVQQRFDEAFAPLVWLGIRLFVVDVTIVLTFTFLAYGITGTILRPIEALYDGARLVSQGELDVEVPVHNAQDEIGVLTVTFNDMTRRLAKNRGEIESAYEQLQQQNEELQRANEVLAQLSITDGLTKLHNHRYFQDHLTREIKRVSRTNEPLAILLIDIDDFKRLNDRLGHAAGDELLLAIARVLNDCVRETDLLARYGGEEFVVLATGTDLDGAVNLAEKIRTAVAEASFILDDSMRPTRVTVSIGVASYADSRKDFFQAADRALYRAKAEGKNCVIAAEGKA